MAVSQFVATTAVLAFIITGLVDKLMSGARISSVVGHVPTEIANVMAWAAVGPLIPLGALALLVLMWALAYLVDLILVRPLELVLRGAAKESVVQITGLFLLAVGIQFDVQTS